MSRNLCEWIIGDSIGGERWFLVHAADVEGLGCGMDERLVTQLGAASPIPVTYAGGATSLDDLETVTRLGNGRVDLTIGSALDLFRFGFGVAFGRLRGLSVKIKIKSLVDVAQRPRNETSKHRGAIGLGQLIRQPRLNLILEAILIPLQPLLEVSSV